MSLFDGLPKEIIIYEIFPHLCSLASDAFRVTNKEFSKILKPKGQWKTDIIEYCFMKFYDFITDNKNRLEYIKYRNPGRKILDQDTQWGQLFIKSAGLLSHCEGPRARKLFRMIIVLNKQILYTFNPINLKEIYYNYVNSKLKDIYKVVFRTQRTFDLYYEVRADKDTNILVEVERF